MNVIFEKIDKIIEKNIDAVEGYEDAIEHVESPTLKQIFINREEKRQLFVNELSHEVKKLHHKPPTEGTGTGTLHRIYINIKSALSDEEEQAVIEECIRGEENLLEEYNELLEHNELPTALRAVFTRHKEELESTIEKLYKLHKQGEHEHSAVYEAKALNPGT